MKIMAPRQIAMSTRGSYLAVKYENIDAVKRTGIVHHLASCAIVSDIIFLLVDHTQQPRTASS
jgi:hypothetical protein